MKIIHSVLQKLQENKQFSWNSEQNILEGIFKDALKL